MTEQLLSQGQSQRLEQNMSRQQLQSLEFLAAPMMELETKIRQELSHSPLLEFETDPVQELKTDDPEILPADAHESVPGDLPDPSNMLDGNREDFEETLADMLERGDNPWLPDSGTPGDSDPGADALREAEERRQYLFDSIANREESLQEQLRAQLRFSDCSPEIRRAAEEIIGSIDDKGYLRTAEGDIAQSVLCSMETVSEALKLVQSFDPPGIGARSVKESLLLQLERRGRGHGKLAELIRNHLDDVAKNRLPQIAKTMDISMEDLNLLLRDLRRLNPYPVSGTDSGGAAAPAVLPEATVVADGDEFKVVPAKEQFPRLVVSEQYLRMLEDPSVSPEVKKFIRENLNSGNLLNRSLEQRKSTILRIAELLVSAQHDFLLRGPEALKPLTQKEIADKLGVHETTVGRAVAGKYLQTPRGLLPFRDFFSGGYETGDGEGVSSGAIKEILRDEVSREDPHAPLSDSRISELLRKRGYEVARRTIAKYREELGIPSSQLRKVFE